MKSFIFTILILHLIAFCVAAQDTKTDTSDRKFEEKYRKLKDSLALHAFIPAVSSTMVNNKQIELNVFMSLESTNQYWDDNANLSEINARQTYFYNTIQLTYGLTKDARFNVGLDINSILGRLDQDRESSPFKVFGSETVGNSRDAKAVTSIAPRIRWRPFKKNYNFTIQSSISFPTPLSAETQSILGPNHIYLVTQFLYNQPLSKRLFLFGQLSTQYGFERGSAPALFYTPASLYLSYLIPKKTILFALANYVPLFTKESSWTYNRYIYQVGGGVQYQISRAILINGYYANNIKGRNYPDLTSYNISLRFIID